MGKFFKQKQGTAIGTKMAPPFAILFMDDLEKKSSKDSIYNLIFGGSTLMTFERERKSREVPWSS